MAIKSPVKQRLTKIIHRIHLPRYWKDDLKDGRPVVMVNSVDLISKQVNVLDVHKIVQITMSGDMIESCIWKEGIN